MPSEIEIQLLQEAMSAEITSRAELANFMAQISHESNGLTRLTEGFRYTRGIAQIPVRSAMREGPEALETARLEALEGRPEKLAELMYGGRMGNDEPGDGYKYHGRGYMQLTGKDNYRAASEALGIDLVLNPDLAAAPENAAKIATWFWKTNVPQAVREDVTAATPYVNGGTVGLPDRQARYSNWHQVLNTEFVENHVRTERTIEQSLLISNRSHADHRLFREATHGLEQLGRQAGFQSRQELENVAATMTCEAKANGLTRIDHVLLNTTGTGIFAVQGRIDDPAHHRLFFNKVESVAQPVEQSSMQLEQQENQRLQQQHQILERQPQQHHHGGRTL